MFPLNPVEYEAIVKHGVQFTPEELDQFMMQIKYEGITFENDDIQSFLFQNGCKLLHKREFEFLQGMTTIHTFQLSNPAYVFETLRTSSGTSIVITCYHLRNPDWQFVSIAGDRH